MKARIGILTAAIAIAGFAHDEPAGKQISVTGTVVDTGCYMSHDAKGDKHLACATMCAKNGIPLAIVDGTGKVYMPVAADHKNPNTRLMPFIEKQVKVTGIELVKGGVNGVAIQTVAAVK